MNSESEKRLSLDELRARNDPAPQVETHPTEEEWSQLIRTLHAIGQVLTDQTLLLEQLTGRQPPTWSQVETLTKELRTVHDLVEQVGKENEKPSWRKRLHLLRISLPDWGTVLFVIALLFAFGLICYVFVMIWNKVSSPLH